MKSLPILLASLLLTAAPAPTRAAPIWSIGQTDHSADEFGGRAGSSIAYDLAAAANPKQWPARQNPSTTCSIRFPLSTPLAPGYRLVVHGFFLEAGPESLGVTVNGHKGAFRLTPVRGQDSDFRQGGNFTYAATTVEAPVSASMLQAGTNVIELTVSGTDGGELNYDSLALEALPEPVPAAETVEVEPSIFFRRTPAGLAEITHVIVRHQSTLAGATISLRIGSSPELPAQTIGDPTEFGESVTTFEVPADIPAGPCEVILKRGAARQTFAAAFKPEKRWKLYAGLKVHNDLGYTNLQKTVEVGHERNVDAILKALRERPAHKFNLENSWIAETYASARTAKPAAELLKRAQEGRLGVGAMYLNLLTGLCSGEELCRSLYFAESLRRDHGVPLEFAALTDTPSQSWGLASLLADVGLSGFALGSNQHRGPLLSNSDLNERSPFYWEGPDGQRVLTFIGRAYRQVGRLQDNGPLPLVSRALAQAMARYRRPDYPLDALYLLGYVGDNADVRDAGAGIVERWNATYAYPQLIPSTDAEYFEYVAKTFGPQLPVFRGDMGSFWADAAGATARDTIWNRDAQHTMPAAEMAASWASLLSPESTYPAEEFRSGWNEMLFYDEHSWGANNSITQPGQRFGAEQSAYKSAHAVRASRAAHDLLQVSLARVVENILGRGAAILVFNPAARQQTSIVEAEIDANQQIYDLRTDKPVALDVVAEHEPRDVGNGLSHWYTGLVRRWRTVRFVAENIPGVGYRSYEVRREDDPVPAKTQAVVNSPWEMNGAFYRVQFDPATGAIRSLVDRESGRELIDPAAGHRLNELVYAAGGEGQTIINNLHHWAPTKLDVSGQTGARLVEHVRTPLGERIRIQAQARNVPLIESEITIYDRLKRIDIVNHIRKSDIREKEAIYFAFPFSASAPRFRYQMHNGWVDPQKDLLPGACSDFFTTQNLVLAGDDAVTVAFATPDLPLVTLCDLNQGRWSRRFNATNGHVYSYVTNNYWDTNIPASQGGDLTFRFYLTTLKPGDPDRVAAFDAATRSQPVAYHVRRFHPMAHAAESGLKPAEGTLLSIDAANVHLSTFKRAEDGNGYILRLVEMSGRAGTATIASQQFAIASAQLTNAVERDIGPLTTRDGTVTVPLQPNRIVTIRVHPAVSPARK